MRILSEITAEIADMWARERPTRKQVLGAVACCLGFLSILAADGYLRYREISEVKSLLAANNFGPVEKKLNDLKGQAFCYNLVMRRDIYQVRISEHNQIAQLYNDAVARAPFSDKYAPLEEMMQTVPITPADINGIIFLAHINPWQDCYVRYGIVNYQ